MDIEERTLEFAVKIVDLYKLLVDDKEFILSKQLLRCGTSIGANVAESQAAQSKKDFISKMSIASKEARETSYWLKLLERTDYLATAEGKSFIFNEIESIINILTKIIKTSQGNLKKEK
jgi:four helix bundle protein